MLPVWLKFISGQETPVPSPAFPAAFHLAEKIKLVRARNEVQLPWEAGKRAGRPAGWGDPTGWGTRRGGCFAEASGVQARCAGPCVIGGGRGTL